MTTMLVVQQFEEFAGTTYAVYHAPFEDLGGEEVDDCGHDLLWCQPQSRLAAGALPRVTFGLELRTQRVVVELLPSSCRVEVHDPDPEPPGDMTVPGPVEAVDPWQEHGRGLLLIRALSSSCGHRPTDNGKAVWFRLATVPPQWRPHTP